MASNKLTTRDVLELVRDCSSQEWQQPDGKRMGATDNSGRRMWFITEDVMQAVREALERNIPPIGSTTVVRKSHPVRVCSFTDVVCSRGCHSGPCKLERKLNEAGIELAAGVDVPGRGSAE